MASFFRSIGREQARGMRQAFYDRVGSLKVVSSGGSIVGDVTGCRLEWRRIEPRTRTYRPGLFWKHTDRRLPEGYGVEWKMMPQSMVNVGEVPPDYLITFRLMETLPAPVRRGRVGLSVPVYDEPNPTRHDDLPVECLPGRGVHGIHRSADCRRFHVHLPSAAGDESPNGNEQPAEVRR